MSLTNNINDTMELTIKILCNQYTHLFSKLENTAIYHEKSSDSQSFSIFKKKQFCYNRFKYPVLYNLEYNEQLESVRKSKGYDTDDDNISEYSYVSCSTMSRIELNEELQGGRLSYDIIETYENSNHEYKLNSFICQKSINNDDPFGIFEHIGHSFDNHLLNKYRLKINQETIDTLKIKIKILQNYVFMESQHKKLMNEINNYVNKFKTNIQLYKTKKLGSLLGNTFVNKFYKMLQLNLNNSLYQNKNTLKKICRTKQNTNNFADISFIFSNS